MSETQTILQLSRCFAHVYFTLLSEDRVLYSGNVYITKVLTLYFVLF